VHGDVSPSNIIVDEDENRVTLTDYDGVTPAGQALQRYNPVYASSAVREERPASPADDIVALAASIYTALTERQPFAWGTVVDPTCGLDLSDPIFAEIPQVTDFLRRAVATNAGFEDADDVLRYVAALREETEQRGAMVQVDAPRRPQEVPRLLGILSAYPGSRYGNHETRGLDSPFAVETYVPTELDDRLLRYVEDPGVNLVILLGNAGDGKTALLQRLIGRLTGRSPSSAERIWDLGLDNGRRLYVNLDGSAAYRGRSAAALLDEFFSPFLDGAPLSGTIRILAINSGPLKQWLASASSASPLVQRLTSALAGDPLDDPKIRVIDLNERSLVGQLEHGEVRSTFVDTILARFLGDGGPDDPWEPCRSCSAQERASHMNR
jgi:serine/threonine protein kinase